MVKRAWKHLGLDEHRLTQDFQFKANTQTSHLKRPPELIAAQGDHIARLRAQLAKVRARWEGHSSDSEGSDFGASAHSLDAQGKRRCHHTIYIYKYIGVFFLLFQYTVICIALSRSESKDVCDGSEA